MCDWYRRSKHRFQLTLTRNWTCSNQSSWNLAVWQLIVIWRMLRIYRWIGYNNLLYWVAYPFLFPQIRSSRIEFVYFPAPVASFLIPPSCVAIYLYNPSNYRDSLFSVRIYFIMWMQKVHVLFLLFFPPRNSPEKPKFFKFQVQLPLRFWKTISLTFIVREKNLKNLHIGAMDIWEKANSFFIFLMCK